MGKRKKHNTHQANEDLNEVTDPLIDYSSNTKTSINN